MIPQFRQRLTSKRLQDINDVITERKTAEQIAAEADNPFGEEGKLRDETYFKFVESAE